jgi:endonuclease G
MLVTRRLPLAVLLCSAAVAVCAAAETGTPYPAGTKVEVATPAGTVTGTLQDRTTDGWILVQEAGRQSATAIPERSVGFLRVGNLAAPVRPAAPTAAARAGDTSDHYLHGRPRVVARDRFEFRPNPSGPLVEGVTVLPRFAFTVGHYDRFKTPAWVAMRWTKEALDASAAEPSHPRPFEADPDLPPYARTGKDYQHGRFGYQRGHMARHEDLSGFPDGADRRRGTREGSLMSNIVPQKQKGHAVWGKLENEHREIVGKPASGIRTLWLISGPVFQNGQAVERIGPAQVGAPHAVYKVIAWHGPGRALTARGYVIHQDDTARDLTRYLTKIDDIEATTGLDFFPDLADPEQAALEAKAFTTLWGPN